MKILLILSKNDCKNEFEQPLYGALAYNQNKVDETHAKVIFTNKMIEPADGNFDISDSCLKGKTYSIKIILTGEFSK